MICVYLKSLSLKSGVVEPGRVSGMVSDMRVFPTKEKCWVSLARHPMVADSRELEKIFRSDPRVCLLSMPPPDRKPTHPRRKPGDTRSGA